MTHNERCTWISCLRAHCWRLRVCGYLCATVCFVAVGCLLLYPTRAHPVGNLVAAVMFFVGWQACRLLRDHLTGLATDLEARAR